MTHLECWLWAVLFGLLFLHLGVCVERIVRYELAARRGEFLPGDAPAESDPDDDFLSGGPVVDGNSYFTWEGTVMFPSGDESPGGVATLILEPAEGPTTLPYLIPSAEDIEQMIREHQERADAEFDAKVRRVVQDVLIERELAPFMVPDDEARRVVDAVVADFVASAAGAGAGGDSCGEAVAAAG